MEIMTSDLRRILIIALLAVLLLPGRLLAKDFEVSVMMLKNDLYYKPRQNKLLIQEQPIYLSVEIKNISDSSQQIYELVDVGWTGYLSFELMDEKKNLFFIKHKQKPIDSATLSSLYLSTGKSKVIAFVLGPEDWENVPELEKGKVKKFKSRVVYDNRGEKIYSDYFDLILDGRVGNEEVKKQSSIQ